MNTKEKVLKILESLGMSGKVSAKAMGVTYTVFRMKKSEQPGHSFNEKNLEDLRKFIKQEADNI